MVRLQEVEKMSRRRLRENPILIKVNPPDKDDIDQDQVERLWKAAAKMKPDLYKREFLKAIEQFYQQHHALPVRMVVRDEPELSDSVKVGCLIGRVPHVLYEAPKYSRKAVKGNKYVHPTDSTYLYSTTDGRVFLISDRMRMKQDGWLHD